MSWRAETRPYADYWDWYEEAVAAGLTDGLPLAPPTVERVEAVLAYLARSPAEHIGLIPPKSGELTVELLAISCVMAGCLPEYVPVVEAAVRAMLDPTFNLHGVQCTTNPCAPLVMVSGPIRHRLGFRSGTGAFGGGCRASAAIGRAVRLILWNVGGGIPAEADMATLGQPAKFTFCVAEDEEASPWEPLHVERGCQPSESAVTVFACQSPAPILVAGGAERQLRVLAATLPTPGVNAFHAAGEYLLVISQRPVRELAAAGYSKAGVKRWLYENARYHLGQLRQSGVLVPGEAIQCYWGSVDGAPDLAGLPDDTLLPMVAGPEQIHILVAGGPTAYFNGFAPGWGNYGGGAVTRTVVAPPAGAREG